MAPGSLTCGDRERRLTRPCARRSCGPGCLPLPRGAPGPRAPSHPPSRVAITKRKETSFDLWHCLLSTKGEGKKRNPFSINTLQVHSSNQAEAAVKNSSALLGLGTSCSDGAGSAAGRDGHSPGARGAQTWGRADCIAILPSLAHRYVWLPSPSREDAAPSKPRTRCAPSPALSPRAHPALLPILITHHCQARCPVGAHSTTQSPVAPCSACILLLAPTRRSQQSPQPHRGLQGRLLCSPSCHPAPPCLVLTVTEQLSQH